MCAQISFTEETKSKMMNRKKYLAEKIIFVDGQAGCGKTLFSPIIAAFDRVELLTYAYEIEHICTLYYLNKIDRDAAIAMVRVLTDLQMYNTMMSRELNFRPSDLSSIFRDVSPLRYLRRLFQKGDEFVPERVKQEKPILHLTTHNLLPFSEPLFAALEDRAALIEIVRHPLYMIKQQVLNMQRLICDVRDFSLYFEYNGEELPFYSFGWEDLFTRSNDVEKTIFTIEKLTAMVREVKVRMDDKYGAKILTIPFECFVLDPDPYMKQIEELIGTKVTSLTRKVMKKQRVPRKMYAQGIGLKIYKRCGWEPPQAGSDENKEFQKRWDFAVKQASPEALEVLNRLCSDYEEKYLGGRKKNGDRYV